MSSVLLFSRPAAANTIFAAVPNCGGDEVARFKCQMRFLGVQLDALDVQITLHQPNFSLLSGIATDIEQSAGWIQAHPRPDLHMMAVRDLEQSARMLTHSAASHDIESLEAVNGLRGSCMQCHGVEESAAHVPSWRAITTNGWSKVPSDCRQPGRNPYVCSSMHALRTYVEYLGVAQAVGIPQSLALEPMLAEISRIAQDLVDRRAVHQGEYGFEPLLKESREIRQVAAGGTPEARSQALKRASGLQQACMRCHAENNSASLSMSGSY